MFQTQAVSPITFRFHMRMQAKIIPTSSCSEKSGKTGKNAPSVTGGQRVVTLCAGVISSIKLFRLQIHFYTSDEMHVNPVKLVFKKKKLFQYSCFAAHVNSVLHPTNNCEFNLKCIFTKSQLNSLIQ